MSNLSGGPVSEINNVTAVALVRAHVLFLESHLLVLSLFFCFACRVPFSAVPKLLACTGNARAQTSNKTHRGRRACGW